MQTVYGTIFSIRYIGNSGTGKERLSRNVCTSERHVQYGNLLSNTKAEKRKKNVSNSTSTVLMSNMRNTLALLNTIEAIVAYSISEMGQPLDLIFLEAMSLLISSCHIKIYTHWPL